MYDDPCDDWNGKIPNQGLTNDHNDRIMYIIIRQ